ncbi:unnamed protein product [Aphanomyces euteiches]
MTDITAHVENTTTQVEHTNLEQQQLQGLGQLQVQNHSEQPTTTQEVTVNEELQAVEATPLPTTRKDNADESEAAQSTFRNIVASDETEPENETVAQALPSQKIETRDTPTTAIVKEPTTSDKPAIKSTPVNQPSDEKKTQPATEIKAEKAPVEEKAQLAPENKTQPTVEDKVHTIHIHVDGREYVTSVQGTTTHIYINRETEHQDTVQEPPSPMEWVHPSLHRQTVFDRPDMHRPSVRSIYKNEVPPPSMHAFFGNELPQRFYGWPGHRQYEVPSPMLRSRYHEPQYYVVRDSLW